MPFPKVPIEKINKMPLAYALMIVGGLLGIAVSKYFDRNEQVIKAYKEEVFNLKAENKRLDMRCDSVSGFWQNKYLASLEQTQELQRKQDSTNRAILNKPNRDLIRAIKTKQYE